MILHNVVAAHYAEARKHELSPMEWGPDEKKHLIELLFDAEADAQGKDDQEGSPKNWSMTGPGFKLPVCKSSAKSD